MEHETPTPRTDDSLEGLLDAFQNLDLDTKNPFIDFYRTEDMAETTPIAKKTELNLPKIFTGKRTNLQRFLQDTFIFLTINKEHYNTDNKKITFVMSFMTDGDAALWKQEFIGKVIRDSVTAGNEITFGTYKSFIESLEKSFLPYDAPGDALDAMKCLRMGEGSFEEHLAKFKLLVSQSGLDESAVVADLFRETLPLGLQRPILLSKKLPVTLQEWYDKVNTFYGNWRKTQWVLGRGKPIETKKEMPRKTFSFPRQRGPNAMDIDRLTTEERTQLMKEGKCFKCRKQGHLSRDCPPRGTETPKPWTGKTAAMHIRSIISGMTQEEKDNLEKEAEAQGLGF